MTVQSDRVPRSPSLGSVNQKVSQTISFQDFHAARSVQTPNVNAWQINRSTTQILSNSSKLPSQPRLEPASSRLLQTPGCFPPLNLP